MQYGSRVNNFLKYRGPWTWTHSVASRILERHTDFLRQEIALDILAYREDLNGIIKFLPSVKIKKNNDGVSY